MQKLNLMRLVPSMASPERKKRKKERRAQAQSNPIVSLPYDLVLRCVAGVSRLYYPTLSLVSKSFGSLIASPELYKARSVLGQSESCLYVCVQPFSGEGPSWYTLCRGPEGGYVLAKVPIRDCPGALSQGLVAVGCNIYNIGGSDLDSMCRGYYSRVTILDCRSHTLSEAPSLRVGLSLLSASVIDGKIYVAGRVKNGDSRRKNSFEVFDTEAQFWETLPSETQSGGVVWYNSAAVDGKFHVVMTDQEVVAYHPKEGRWDLVGTRMGRLMVAHDYCVIDNVLYSASLRDVKWYDTEVRMWRDLMGLVGLPDLTAVRLANYGGKMVLLWEEDLLSCRSSLYYRLPEKKIFCAEIALERRNNHEIWGKLEWLHHVLTLRQSSRVVKVLATTV